jgi:hypothetical protein
MISPVIADEEVPHCWTNVAQNDSTVPFVPGTSSLTAKLPVNVPPHPENGLSTVKTGDPG